MIKIHYPTAFKALDKYINAYNERTEKSTQKIKSAATLTAKEIVRIYGVFLLKANGIASLSNENLPPLRTNNQQLASLVKCSPRSIQRYIQKLQASGVILNKVFHGSNASYALWINPAILFINPKISTEPASEDSRAHHLQSAQKTIQPLFLNSITTTCPHTYPAGYIYNIINSVHNREPADTLQSSTGYATGYSVAGHTQGKSLPGENGNKGGGGPVDPARAACLDFYVLMLWTLARNVLYKDIFITKEQEAIARKHIRSFYDPVPDNLLGRVHEIYIERIDLVSKYLRKEPQQRYVQLPHRYFDINNPGGFTGTKKWWYVYNERKKEVQKKLILHAQIKKFQRNLKNTPAKQRPLLEVFRECEQRISKLKDPMLLQQFHSMVLPPYVSDQLNSNRLNHA